MPQTIRKALITAFGDPSNINIVESTIDEPPKDHVQIQVLYSGMAGADINMRLGTYPFQKKAPLTPGYCLVGRVQTNGPNSKKYNPGDLVACLTVYDSEAELVNQPEKYLVPVPDGIDIQQATAMILDWNTAYGMVMRAAKVSAGQRVFIHGISGAVGFALMQLCLLQGAEVYGTASPSNHLALKELGATAFTYRDRNWIMAMKVIGGAHAVFDALGFESWDDSYSILAKEGGILVGYGSNLPMLKGQPPRAVTPSVVKLLSRNLLIGCPHKTRFYYIDRDQATFRPELEALFEMALHGKIDVRIKKVWSLEQVPEAHRNWNSMGGMGSILIKVAEDSKV